MSIPRIVLTGGPCAGKTSALSRLRARLQSYGRQVYTTSEASTLMLDGGAHVVGTTDAQKKIYQTGVLRITLAIEDSLLAFARGLGVDAVLICDRGAMDGLAYIGSQLWGEIMADVNVTVAELRNRYDAVLHLITAADGAEAFYGNENNPGRYEDVEGARAVDLRLRQAWQDHADQRVIDNSTDFDEKMRRIVSSVCAHVGVPGPGLWERKYLVRPIDTLPAAQTIDIEQTYLMCDDHETRVRKCTHRGVVTYTHTMKKDTPAGRRVEVERPITLREYNTHLENADTRCVPIVKRRRVYPHAGLYFQLDEFLSPRQGLWIMEVEMDDPAQSIEVPPFVEVEKEVTSDRQYWNASLARKPV